MILRATLFTLSFTASYAGFVCDDKDNWKTVEGSTRCYRFFPTDDLTYKQYLSKCRQMGAQLARIENDAENALASKIATQNGKPMRAYFGLTDSAQEGKWRWSDGTPLKGYINWALGEPNDDQRFKGEDCAVVNWAGQKWNDVQCKANKYSEGFVCSAEKTAPAPGSIVGDRSKCRSPGNNDGDGNGYDCCAPASIKEKAVCADGYISHRTGKPCASFKEGDYTCIGGTCDNSQCLNGECCAPLKSGIDARCKKGFTPRRTNNKCSFKGKSYSSGSFTCCKSDTPSDNQKPDVLYDDSKCNSIGNDCCAPKIIGEEATCTDGYIPFRTNEPCFDYKEGTYKCMLTAPKCLGNSCYFLTPRQTNFNDAKRQCELNSGHLAVIDSAAENTFVNKVCGERTCWLGLHQEKKNDDSTYKWVDGKDLKYKNWHDGEPNNYGGKDEDTAIMNLVIKGFPKITDGSWFDAPADTKLPFGVCEFDISSIRCDNKKCTSRGMDCCAPLDSKELATCSGGFSPFRSGEKCGNSEDGAYTCCTFEPKPTADSLAKTGDRSKCRSPGKNDRLGNDNYDCCAPLEVREAATCEDGYIPHRTGQPCSIFKEGDYTCLAGRKDDSKCMDKNNNCCVEGGESMKCKDGFTPRDLKQPCGDKGRSFGCYSSEDPKDNILPGLASTTYDDSMCSSKGMDCCAPNGEAATCKNGYYPWRTGKKCFTFDEGQYKCSSGAPKCVGTSCYFVSPILSNHYDAAAQCEINFGSLAIITSKKENDLAQEVCGYRSCWIGLEEMPNTETWVWTDKRHGSQIPKYLNWHEGEPNNWGPKGSVRDENTAVMNLWFSRNVGFDFKPQINGQWYDVPGQQFQAFALCEIDISSIECDEDKCSSPGAGDGDCCAPLSHEEQATCRDGYTPFRTNQACFSVTEGQYACCKLKGGKETTLSGSNDPKKKNLQACIGECDNDGQCAAGLKCFQREHGEKIPGCTGLGGGNNWDYCYDPNYQEDKCKTRNIDCGEHGSCFNGQCFCRNNYSGERCKTPPNPCDTKNCNYGSCEFLGGKQAYCNCRHGYDGDQCDKCDERNGFVDYPKCEQPILVDGRQRNLRAAN